MSDNDSGFLDANVFCTRMGALRQVGTDCGGDRYCLLQSTFVTSLVAAAKFIQSVKGIHARGLEDSFIGAKSMNESGVARAKTTSLTRDWTMARSR